MRKFLLLVSGFVLMSSLVWAQGRTITGKVTASEDGSPLPGVNVLVKGTTTGTVTDANGSYSVDLSNGTTLVFSFIGYVSQEVEVGARNTVDVVLQADVKQLSEVVVTGYGSQLKQDLTGNIAQVKAKDIEFMPVPTVDAALQGRAAGVYVNSQSGKLGQAVSVRIRGNSSITAGNQPLYVVDGIPITATDLSGYGGATNSLIDLNPNDIESIEVLKDASAGAIYGARASNGVVLITTKKGKAGKTTVNFNYQTGFSESTKRVDFLNSQQYAELLLEGAAYTDNFFGVPTNDPGSDTQFAKDLMNYYSYDEWETNPERTYEWQDVVFQRGAMQQADMQVNGGNENTKFFLSGQYLKQEGIIIGNDIERITARLNLDHKASEWLSLGLNMNFARTYNRRLPDDNAFSNPLQSVALMPMTPNVIPAGQPGAGLPAGTPPGDPNIPLYYNPQITVDYAKYTAESFRNFSNGFATIKLAPGLTFHSMFGLDVLNQVEEGYFQTQTVRNQTRASKGLGSNRTRTVVNWNTNNYFNYIKNIGGKHDITATLGMEYQQSDTRGNFVEGLQFPSDSYQKIISAAVISGGSSTQSQFSFLSYFARANYKFANKYLFSVSARSDGSSRFGANNRYGFFPAVSGGWVMTEESFLSDSRYVSFLKLRASYGLVGNSEIQNFQQFALFSSAPYGPAGGQSPTQLGNPNLRWETSRQLDVGVDFGFFNNRLTGELDYYNRQSEDLLLNVNVPSSTGFNTVVKNLGSMENKGVELVLNGQILVGEFKWSASFNIAHNRGKVTDINGQIIEGGVSNMNRVMEGENVGVFFAPEYAGVDPATGDALFVLNTTNPDGTIDRSTVPNADYNRAQRVVVGDPNPDYIGGFTNNFSYKGFDLSVFFNGVFGNDINIHGMGQYSIANMRFEDNQTADQMNRWRQPGDVTDVPQVRYYFGNGWQRSSRYVVDGSFIRLRTVNLGYTVPKKWLAPIKLTSARVYVSGQNLLTFTDYPLWDPEVNADSFDSNISKGNDFYTPPQPRTILVGVNIGF